MAIVNCEDCGKPMVGIHTCTPKRWKEWVNLTDEDIFGIFGTYRGDLDYNHDKLLLDARRIEAILKERNT